MQAEIEILGRLFAEQRELFSTHLAARWSCSASAMQPPIPRWTRSILPAGTVLAQAIFNHDEAIMRR
jgi:hypothetical protein